MAIKIAIVGGGIGGLTLAQKLKKAGVAFDIYERDASPDDRLQGYRVHLSPEADRALSECLPTELYDLFIKTSGVVKRKQALLFLNTHLDELMSIPSKQTNIGRSASRVILRKILLSGLEENVHFNKKLTRYETLDNKQVRLFFSDGTSTTADVLVGADGISSQTRSQLLPNHKIINTNVFAILGKSRLNDIPSLPPSLSALGAANIIAQGSSMFISTMRYSDEARDYLGYEGESSSSDIEEGTDYIYWAFRTEKSKYGIEGDLRDLSDGAKLELVLKKIERWHPFLTQLVQSSAPSTCFVRHLQTSRRPSPWQTGTVTLLGDAIHPMPPTAGIGASTALVDADHLGTQLIAACNGEKNPIDAINVYEKQMLDYGFSAVDLSDRNLRLMSLENPVALVALKTLLKTINLLIQLRHNPSGLLEISATQYIFYSLVMLTSFAKMATDYCSDGNGNSDSFLSQCAKYTFFGSSCLLGVGAIKTIFNREKQPDYDNEANKPKLKLN